MLPRLTPAMRFILLLGVVSLFSDMTHEGATSVRGAYLALLGASATTIGFVSGLGELVGYGLRYAFGRFTDRTRRYWPMTILGYAIDVCAVPLLALVGEDGWRWACALLVVERLGKAVKKPAKSALLSFAASRSGAGKSFALHEALDQLGAFLGPLMLYAVMSRKGGDACEVYAACFALLAIPAALTMLCLLLARRRFPHPEQFEPESARNTPAFTLRRPFALYLAAISCFAFGFADFALITMHAARSGWFAEAQLPLLYAAAMLVDALAALAFGWLYDRCGVRALMLSTLVSAGFAALVFGGTSRAAMLAGVALWGVGMGAQESIFKAAVATMVPKSNRAAGYGVFELAFGASWFLGSWLLGALYDTSLLALIAVSTLAQLASVPLCAMSGRASAS